MEQKTKKQHYVPQCYLKAWSFSDKEQIYVYDRITDSIRINSVKDVAAERYFYDINPYELLPEAQIAKLHEQGFNWDTNKKSQIIEHAFADEIEKPFSNILKGIIETVTSATSWYINNCFLIGTNEKYEFSAYLTMQFLRTKYMRSRFIDNADCLTQMLADMGASDESIEKYSMSKEKAQKMHIKMFLNVPELIKTTKLFYRLTWLLGINRTDTKLLTTDNPIGTHRHIKHPIMAMNGLASKGVEVFYPISPNLILIMFDGTYHKEVEPYDRWYIELNDSSNIDYYNSLMAMRADRMIFSCDNNFAILEEMKRKNPDVFRQARGQLKWGDNVYYPRKR